jgi:hypothetical protein
MATLPGPCGGLSVFGDRKIEVSPGDGPEICIDGFSLLGDVEVTDGPRCYEPLTALDRSHGRRLAQACDSSEIAASRTATEPQNFNTHGTARAAKTRDSTALDFRSMVRMGSPVGAAEGP